MPSLARTLAVVAVLAGLAASPRVARLAAFYDAALAAQVT
jgi:hypothetical protein